MAKPTTPPSPPDWLDHIHIITGDAIQAKDIASELNVKTGAIITPMLCRVVKAQDQLVLVLMAGDMACDPAQVSKALKQPNAQIDRLSEAEITQLTGDSSEFLFPIQLSSEMTVVLDASLQRFPSLFSRAGSRKCMIETTYKDLKELTSGLVSYALSGSLNWRT